MSDDNFLPFAMPSITEEEIQAVVETLRTGWITTGPKAKQFEEDFAKFIGCKYAVAVNSCTAALHLALEAVGVQEGDGIITSPMTFAATAEVIHYFRARPIFVDIDPVTMNIDPHKIESYLSSCSQRRLKLPKAIIPVHYAGRPCEMAPILDIAKRYHLAVIEDAAHAFPAFYGDKIIGTLGDITCFSFYATKNISTGEGGMITTENEEWAERMRIMSLHGISKDAWKRYTAEGSWYYEILAPGYKYNLTDIAAVIGIVQLKKANALWRRRIHIASRYHDALKDFAEIEVPEMNDGCSWKDGSDQNGYRHGWHLYVIKLNLETLDIDRDRFIGELKQRRIGTSVHFIPLHIHPYYRDTFGYKPEDFSVAYKTYKRIISLPIYPGMLDSDVEKVIDAVTDVVTLHKK
ncbi:MAG TPA: DegT/DnrJ/EryC1/StrS aminotransferase family protein [Thermodesulfobacteriota bacterium]|nr:DegT/DnrJ/EryC1/StrS aminotransferase family protein [Thermodesulfobacteriota bacterium]